MSGAGRVHRLSAEDFDGLAIGRPGPAALEVLRQSQLSWRLLTLRAVAALGRERVPRLWRESGAERGWALLGAVHRADRSALEQVLLHPPLGVLLARCLRQLTGPAAESRLEGDLARLPEVAVAAALRAGLPLALDLPVRGDLLALPTWGVARLPAGTGSVRVQGRTLTAPGFAAEVAPPEPDPSPTPTPDPSPTRTPGPGPAPGRASAAQADPPPGAPGWLPLRALALRPSDPLRHPAAPVLRVTLEDCDPDRHAHGAPGTTRLTGHQLAVWESSLSGAWDLLCTHFPDQAAVCAALCHCVVPLTPPPGRWVTSASREAFGCVGLSPTTDPVRLAEALVHEVSHVALGALGDLVDLYDPDYTGRHRVGWRPDPRPLGAVLQGTYAHVAVVGFRDHHRRIGPRADAARSELRHRQLRDQVLEALDLLDGCPGLTALGRRFCDGMAAAVGVRPGQATPRYSNG
ncbi:HEXXH motif domain-containing protein [Peterkaempfera bronchialis]|uniref:HEXXH motif domain-containing protein n=1 Tax=Peterkaempfera bronchialis TaxID=2126346 RepID=UPI003C2B0029